MRDKRGGYISPPVTIDQLPVVPAGPGQGGVAPIAAPADDSWIVMVEGRRAGPFRAEAHARSPRPSADDTLAVVLHSPDWEPDVVTDPLTVHRGLRTWRWDCACGQSGDGYGTEVDARGAFLDHKYGVGALIDRRGPSCLGKVMHAVFPAPYIGVFVTGAGVGLAFSMAAPVVALVVLVAGVALMSFGF